MSDEKKEAGKTITIRIEYPLTEAELAEVKRLIGPECKTDRAAATAYADLLTKAMLHTCKVFQKNLMKQSGAEAKPANPVAVACRATDAKAFARRAMKARVESKA